MLRGREKKCDRERGGGEVLPCSKDEDEDDGDDEDEHKDEDEDER